MEKLLITIILEVELLQFFRWILFLVIGGTLLIAYVAVISGQINEIRDVAANSLSLKEKVLSDLKEIKKDLDKIVIDFSALKSSRQAAMEQLNNFLPTSPHYEELFTMVPDITDRAGFPLNTLHPSLPPNQF